MRRAVLAVLTLVLLVLGSLVAAATWWLGRNGPPPVLLIQHSDGNLVLADAAGQLRPLTTDADGNKRIYAFPVPAPDGRSIAYVETLHGTEAVTSSLVVHHVRTERRAVFDSTDIRPFYLHWSPDSRQIAFLASDRAGMVLHTVSAQGEPALQRVTPGQPSYFSWSPDSRRLLLHTGTFGPRGSLSTWALGDDKPRIWNSRPALFQAPSWLDDGRTAIAVVVEDGEAALARIGEDGTVQQRVAKAALGMLFVLAPDSRQIAYVPLSQNNPGNIHIVGVDGANDREVPTGPVLTFLWSPDGKRIAYVTEADDKTPAVAWRAQRPPSLAWNVLDVASGETRTFKGFVPSTEFLNVLPFFDQYAQSIRLWDKSGQRLVYADQAGVWTLDVSTGAAVRVDSGVLGMWIER